MTGRGPLSGSPLALCTPHRGPLEKGACPGCLLMFSHGLDCGQLCEAHHPLPASCPASAAQPILGFLYVSHDLLAVNYNKSLV